MVHISNILPESHPIEITTVSPCGNQVQNKVHYRKDISGSLSALGLCENARDWRPDCVRSDTGEDLADRRGKIRESSPASI